MQGFNVQFKNSLVYHTDQTKKMKRENKQKKRRAIKSGYGHNNPWDPPEKVRETMVGRIYGKGKFWVWNGTETLAPSFSVRHPVSGINFLIIHYLSLLKFTLFHVHSFSYIQVHHLQYHHFVITYHQIGYREFPVADSPLWNSLPPDITSQLQRSFLESTQNIHFPRQFPS